MLKILQAHLLRAFVANLKIDAIYALYPESFCDKNLAVRKVFAFSDSESQPPQPAVVYFFRPVYFIARETPFLPNFGYFVANLRTFGVLITDCKVSRDQGLWSA